jgi:prolyl-tRNA synthetase
MRTRLFLRTTEFLWQEGHTAHKTKEEAQKETLDILELYKKLAEEYLAIPVYTGLKTEAEKFAGADKTYCIEAMMLDKKALQAGTSHNLGQNFAKAFDVKFQTEDNNEEYVWATSWGISTRLIGAVILAHGDKNGLRIPPKIAPIQVVLIPIFRNEKQRKIIEDYIEPITKELKQNEIRTFIDWSDSSPGYKFNEWELKGIPARIEIGPRDVESNTVIIARRDNGEKLSSSSQGLTQSVKDILDQIQNNLYNQAKDFRDNNTHSVNTYSEFKDIIKNGGFVRCGWDGKQETELKIKEDTKATIRCIPFNENPKDLTCIFSGNEAMHEVIFAKSY